MHGRLPLAARFRTGASEKNNGTISISLRSENQPHAREPKLFCICDKRRFEVPLVAGPDLQASVLGTRRRYGGPEAASAQGTEIFPVKGFPNAFLPKVSCDLRLTSDCQCSSQRRVRDEGGNRSDERGHISNREKQPGLSVSHDVDDARGACTDDRCAGSLRFENDGRQTLAMTWKSDKIGKRVIRRCVFNRAGENDVRMALENFSGFVRKRIAVLETTRQNETEMRKLLVE